VGVNLLAILLLQTEDHLNRWEIGWVIALRPNQLLVCGDRQLRGIFELFQSAWAIGKLVVKKP
jgi:hypothetical protein